MDWIRVDSRNWRKTVFSLIAANPISGDQRESAVQMIAAKRHKPYLPIPVLRAFVSLLFKRIGVDWWFRVLFVTFVPFCLDFQSFRPLRAFVVHPTVDSGFVSSRRP